MSVPYAMKCPTLSLCLKSSVGGSGVSESQTTVATIAQPTAIHSRLRRKPRILEQAQVAAERRRADARAIQLGARAGCAVTVQPVLAAGDVEALLHQLGIVAGAGHASAEARVVVLAAAHLAHDADHVLGALRVVLGEPFLEEILELVGQPHDHVGGLCGA